MASDLRALVDAVRETRERVDDPSVSPSMAWLDAIGRMQDAERTLADALLAHPEWVDAVEVLTALGAAKYVCSGCVPTFPQHTDECDHAHDDAFAVADRLHALGGG